jgi:hypothetical protein
MTYSDLLQLDSALTQLSGTVTRLVDNKPVAIHLQFTGTTRLRIAKFASAVKAALEPYHLATEAILKQHGGPFEKPGLPGHAETVAEISQLLKHEVEPVSAELPEAEFIRDDNPVSPSALETLLPYLT